MAKVQETDIDTTADEKGYGNEVSSNSSNSDVELDYDKKHRILKAKYNDKVIDVKFKENCKTMEDALNHMLIKYLSQIELQRKTSQAYCKRVKEDKELTMKVKECKAKWFQDNKERLREQQLNKYTNDDEFRQRIIDKNKRAYDKKTEGVEKKKRGRKTIPKPVPTDTDIPRRPRGRPARQAQQAGLT
jgi:hypothetical protein